MRLMSHKSYTQSYDNKTKMKKRVENGAKISLFIGAHKLLIVQLTNTWDSGNLRHSGERGLS